MSFEIAKAIYVIAFLLSAILTPSGFVFGQSSDNDYANEVLTNDVAASDISTPERFLNYLAANRSNVAIAGFSLKSNGDIDFREPIIAHNIDVRMPLQSLGKVVHLAAYAKAVSKGEISPYQIVSVGDWERYYLPGADGFAHGAALEDLGIPIDEYGFAVNPETPVTLEQMVRAMIRYSDNAVPDWLLANISRQTFAEVIDEGGLTGQDFPTSLLGADLSYENHERGLLSAASVRELKRLKPRAYAALVNRLRDKFQTAEWRQAELQWRLENIEQTANPVFLQEVVDALATKGTVRDYAFLMARVAHGSFISPEVSATMRNFLEQSLLLETIGETNLFSVFGEKIGGSSGGFVTNANYAVPSVGDYAGKRRITVLFQRRINLTVLGEQFRTLIPFKFETKMARERAFSLRVRRVFNGY